MAEKEWIPQHLKGIQKEPPTFKGKQGVLKAMVNKASTQKQQKDVRIQSMNHLQNVRFNLPPNDKNGVRRISLSLPRVKREPEVEEVLMTYVPYDDEFGTTLMDKINRTRTGDRPVIPEMFIRAHDRAHERKRRDSQQKHIEEGNKLEAASKAKLKERHQNFQQVQEDLRVRAWQCKEEQDKTYMDSLPSKAFRLKREVRLARDAEAAANEERKAQWTKYICLAFTINVLHGVVRERRVLRIMRKQDEAATKIAHGWHIRTMHKRKHEGSDMIKDMLRNRQRSHKVLWKLLSFKKKVMCVQHAWRMKQERLEAQVDMLSVLWGQVDQTRIEKDVIACTKKDARWVVMENERIAKFNQQHTGRVAGAQAIAKMLPVDTYPLEKIFKQIPYFGNGKIRLVLWGNIIARQMKYYSEWISYERSVLWPEFLELYRQENVHIPRSEILPICQRMRRNGGMETFLEDQGMDFEVQPFKMIPTRDEFLKFIQSEAKEVQPELSPHRQSDIPISANISSNPRRSSNRRRSSGYGSRSVRTAIAASPQDAPRRLDH
jgi:hypothetical protein